LSRPCCFGLRWLAFGLVLGWLAWAGPAQAERVVVFRPLAPHPMLEEIFNRLRGELQMHGYVVLFATAPEPPDLALLEAGAERGAARAAIALTEQDGTATVQVWLDSAAAPSSGKLEARLATADADGASELALRTIELIRASLERDPGVGAVPPPPSASEPPRVVPPPAPAPVVRPDEPKSRLRLEAAGALDAGESSFGPLIAWGYRLGPVVELGFTFVGPMLGAEFETAQARARVTWFGMGPELRYAIPLGALRLEAQTELLVERVSVEGRGSAPVLGRDDARWVGALGLGGALAVPLGQKLELTGGLRTGWAWPRPTLAIEERRISLGRPTWLVSSGMSFGL